MTILLAESFDPYNAYVDLQLNGWNNASSTNHQLTTTTPFGQGQALSVFAAGSSAYQWHSNEPIVYGSFYFLSHATNGPGNYVHMSFTDNAVIQLTLRFGMDGSLGIYTGTATTGALIQSFPGSFQSDIATVWSSFQFKIVFAAGTSGSVEIRKNGSAANLITATGINTRNGTGNAYANGVLFAAVVGTSTNGQGYFDNLYLTNTDWVNEMRAFQQRPLTVLTPNFSTFPATTTQQLLSNAGSTSTFPTTQTNYVQFVAAATGTVTSLTFLMQATIAGNVKFAIYDNTGINSNPGAVLATSTPFNNPIVVGGATPSNIAIFPSPATVIIGKTYYLAFVQDVPASYKGANTSSFSTIAVTDNTSYASFPVTNPPVGLPNTFINMPTAVLNLMNNDAAVVQELQQDGDTSYIFSTGVAEDQFTLSPMPAVNYTITAVQYYAFWRKSDVGTRTAELRVTANGSVDTVVASATPVLNYTYAMKLMELDPVGIPWTPTTVNSAILGIKAA